MRGRATEKATEKEKLLAQFKKSVELSSNNIRGKVLRDPVVGGAGQRNGLTSKTNSGTLSYIFVPTF